MLIGSNIPMKGVGISDKSMNVPSNVAHVGMLSTGGRPTDRIGNILIGGHVSDTRDRPGALHRLTTVKKGAKVVVRVDNKPRNYKVVSKHIVNRDKPLPSWVFDSKGKHRVVIVSCATRQTKAGGGFHYRDNIIEVAEPA